MICRFLVGWFFLVGWLGKVNGQVPFPDTLVTAEWEKAGVRDSIPIYATVFEFEDFMLQTGGNADLAYRMFLDTWDRKPATLSFGKDTFRFSQPMIVPSYLVIQGAGAGQTHLVFDLGGSTNAAIQIRGALGGTTLTPTAGWSRGATHIPFDSTSIDPAWYYLDFQDSMLVTSTWALKTTGALYHLTPGLESHAVEAHTPLRIGVDLDQEPRFRLVHPVEGSGVECLSVIRQDATVQQSSTLYMDLAVDCWILGVESTLSNFAHIDIRRSAHITVRGNYLQDAHAFGGGGQGYGVVLQYGSSMCELSNTIFRRLRHAVLLQAGANGNVIAYNYSIDPFWTQTGLPANSAGDMVCHGNYPYLNLFEGNVCQNIVVDASHGRNGPHNYFFRNRADTYGIFMSPGSGTDSTHFIGNEVTSQVFLQGLYSLIGLGNIEYANRVRGIIRPANTTLDYPNSLYLHNQPPPFWQDGTWPRIGINDISQSGSLPARDRYESEQYTDCTSNYSNTLSVTNLPSDTEILTLSIFPNPAGNYIQIDTATPSDRYLLVDQYGRSSILPLEGSNTFYLGNIPAGLYYIFKLDKTNSVIAKGKFLKL